MLRTRVTFSASAKMVLSGVTNREALLALVFFETAWWGTIGFGIILPSFFVSGLVLPRTAIGWFMLLALLGSVVFKLLTVAFFWFSALLQNQEKCKICLKVWCVWGIVSDVAFFVVMGAIGIYYHFQITWGFPSAYLTSLFLRIGFWICTSLILRTLTQENGIDAQKQKFGSAIAILSNWAWEKSFLLWEVFWYAIVLICFIQTFLFEFSWKVMLPAHYVNFPITFWTYCFLIISAFLTLLGILRNWKSFLKIWVLTYTITGFGLYGWSNMAEIVFPYVKKWTLQWWIDVGIDGSFVLVTLFFRSVTLIRCIRFAYGASETARDEIAAGAYTAIPDSDFEKQPLITLPQKKEDQEE